MPESVYSGLNYGETKHDHGELDKAISAYMGAVASGKKVSTAWEQGLNGILDAYFGPVPETFTVDGKTYTPQSYASHLGLAPVVQNLVLQMRSAGKAPACA